MALLLHLFFKQHLWLAKSNDVITFSQSLLEKQMKIDSTCRCALYPPEWSVLERLPLFVTDSKKIVIIMIEKISWFFRGYQSYLIAIHSANKIWKIPLDMKFILHLNVFRCVVNRHLSWLDNFPQCVEFFELFLLFFIFLVMVILVSFLWGHHPNFPWNFAITR